MNALSDGTLFELQKLLDDYDRLHQPGNPTKDEPQEVEVGAIVLEIDIH